MNVAKQYASALSLLFILYIADFFITKAIIGNTTFEAEANPIMHWLITTYHSVWAIMTVKVFMLWLITIFVGLCNVFGAPDTKRRVSYYLWALVGITVCVDIWSLNVLRVVS